MSTKWPPSHYLMEMVTCPATAGHAARSIHSHCLPVACVLSSSPHFESRLTTGTHAVTLLMVLLSSGLLCSSWRTARLPAMRRHCADLSSMGSSAASEAPSAVTVGAEVPGGVAGRAAAASEKSTT